MTNHKPELRATSSPIAIGRMGYRDIIKQRISARSMESVIARMAQASAD